MSGDIPISPTLSFCWLLTGETIPEIYGWVRDNNTMQVLKGSAGYYRTAKPDEAAYIAQLNLGRTTNVKHR